MIKLSCFLLFCLLLTGCTVPTVPQPQTSLTTDALPNNVDTTLSPEATDLLIPVNIYVPDENAENFNTIPTVIQTEDATLIVNLLIEHSILNDDILLNSIELNGTQLNLDFNQGFMNQLCSYGTAGERMMMGCVVNTFLSVYDAESVFITVNGEILESGHVIYDFPMTYFE